jgi:hypothetical protein
MALQVENFHKEIAAAAQAYDKYIVCLEKPPDDCLTSLQSLMAKAIDAFETRAPGLRHGIALDRYITIILSERDAPVPHCGIYFNLHSPYQRKATAGATPAKPAG